MTELWGGRFDEEADETFLRFNASLSFDHRLLECDIRGARVHAEALKRAEVLDAEETRTIDSALEAIRRDIEARPQILEKALEAGVEDVHSFVEAELVNRIGPLGFKLNTGRSRNDQVATDLRLYVREALRQTGSLVQELREAILDLAEAHPDTVIAGYTHLQKAQPILFAHYLLAYFEMLGRDRQRLQDARRRVDICPLGAGALAGSNYPLDRELQARLLGFDSPSENSLDAVSDRDFAIEFSGAACLTMMHLSRLAEDWIIYSSSEFGFIEFSDKVATGSSLLPQKKNPDGLELIRGKTARVYGNHTTLLTLLKGLPLAYNKDLQEDKEALFDTVDTLCDCLRVTRIILENTRLNDERLAQVVEDGFLNATELADYLARKGLPFRQAHEAVGKVVREALASGRRLEEMSLQEYRHHSDLFEEDLYQAISLACNLAAKDVLGGTAPRRVREALARARSRIQ